MDGNFAVNNGQRNKTWQLKSFIVGPIRSTAAKRRLPLSQSERILGQ